MLCQTVLGRCGVSKFDVKKKLILVLNFDSEERKREREMEILSLLFISTLIVGVGTVYGGDGEFVLKFFIAEVCFVSLVIAGLCLLA